MMKTEICKCIPELLESPKILNVENYKQYENDLYNILENDFVNHEVLFF